jgi:hypothetical protein
MTAEEVLLELQSLGTEQNRRFTAVTVWQNQYGVSYVT